MTNADKFNPLAGLQLTRIDLRPACSADMKPGEMPGVCRVVPTVREV